MGKCALKSHSKGTKHVQLMKMKHSDPTVLSIRDALVGTSPSLSPTTTAAANQPVESVTTMQQQSSADNEESRPTEGTETAQLIDKLLELENCP